MLKVEIPEKLSRNFTHCSGVSTVDLEQAGTTLSKPIKSFLKKIKLLYEITYLRNQILTFHIQQSKVNRLRNLM